MHSDIESLIKLPLSSSVPNLENTNYTDGLVSAIIPSYNMEDFVLEAIASALSQTYPHVEVIVVDDGSVDRTADRVAKLSSDSRLKYFYQENQGLPAARNAAIEHSNGEFIALLDADDLWLPDKISLQVEYLRSSGVGLACALVQRIDEFGKHLPNIDLPLSTGKVGGKLLFDNFITCPTAIFRRTCLEATGLFDENLTTGEDYDLWLRISSKYQVGSIAQRLAKYRVRKGQMSSNQTKMISNAIRIMRRFEESETEAYTESEQKLAWAKTYVTWSNFERASFNSSFLSLRLYLKALSFKFTYMPAWKGLIKWLIRYPGG